MRSLYHWLGGKRITSVEVLVLIPLLVIIIMLNAVLIDSLKGELEEAKKLDEYVHRLTTNSTHRSNGSLLP
jgi:hypothetical protein